MREAARNCEFVGDGKCRRSEERQRGVERSRQRARLEDRRLSARREKSEAVVPAYMALHVKTPIHIEQGRAAADEYVLAVVDDLAGARVLIRRGPSAQIR